MLVMWRGLCVHEKSSTWNIISFCTCICCSFFLNWMLVSFDSLPWMVVLYMKKMCNVCMIKKMFTKLKIFRKLKNVRETRKCSHLVVIVYLKNCSVKKKPLSVGAMGYHLSNLGHQHHLGCFAFACFVGSCFRSSYSARSSFCPPRSSFTDTCLLSR